VFTSRLEPARTGPASTLAVFVHGWSSSSRNLAEVIELVRDKRPRADCLIIDHDGGGILSNARPERIADEIAQEIDYHWIDGPAPGAQYDDLILVGHSAGALLLRKAYAFACGFDDDSESHASYRWAPFVDRIVCLAGLDRGLSFVTKPENMAWPYYVARRIAYNLARLTRTATFLRSLQRGEPFVANLRIQWIRMMEWRFVDREDEVFSVNLRLQLLRMSQIFGEGVRIAPTFQLVGDHDDLVARSDSIDSLFKSSNYVYRSVTGADHESILHPRASPYVRREIVDALTVEPPRTNDFNHSQMTDVFYVIHGIRDLGRAWTPPICDQIALAVKTANDAFPAGDPRRRTARTVRPSYGYFSMLSFLFSWDRQKNVRWWVDLYTQMVARYPFASHHYVGHSNGTYLLASALSRYATCRVRNVVFAGSVVPSAYDWTKLEETSQVAHVRNDAGSADWVVALFPHLFEFAADLMARFDLNAPKWLDLGAAGFNGFYDDFAHDNLYLPGDHSAALKVPNYPSIAESAVHGTDAAPYRIVPNHNPIVELASKLSWLIVPPVAAALILLDVYLWLHYPWPAGAAFAVVLLLLLYTL
jgi:hypothetical protein